jgi:hypothetical protein
MALSEQAPVLTLYDVLQNCKSLREDRAKVGFPFVTSYLLVLAVVGFLLRPPLCVGHGLMNTFPFENSSNPIWA